MSTLNVANISDDQSTLTNSANPSDKLNNTTTVDTKFVTNGCAKAWCAWKAVNDKATFGSFNISSLNDIAVGQTTLSLSSAFGARDYAGSSDNIAQSTAATFRGGLNYYACTASSLEYRCGKESSYFDTDYNAVTVQGDLA